MSYKGQMGLQSYRYPMAAPIAFNKPTNSRYQTTYQQTTDTSPGAKGGTSVTWSATQSIALHRQMRKHPTSNNTPMDARYFQYDCAIVRKKLVISDISLLLLINHKYRFFMMFMINSLTYIIYRICFIWYRIISYLFVYIKYNIKCHVKESGSCLRYTTHA